jgi:hypothetical protein
MRSAAFEAVFSSPLFFFFAIDFKVMPFAGIAQE